MKNPQNQAIVCTVFEGHYHKGVAALVNSLFANGYEGTVWVGYKGALPPWAIITHQENDVSMMRVCDTLTLHFVQFPKDAFLPYCKPNFMLDLLENRCPDAETIVYLDCDIIVKCPFSYFVEWSNFGVALCEDVSSPIPATHPLRYQWENYFKKYGITVHHRDNLYVNGGFVGIKRASKAFLTLWRDVQNLMLEDMKEVKSIGTKDRTYMFNWTDQDALNIAKDATYEKLSIADGTAMDLNGFGYIMSHALGANKPWQKNWLAHVIKKGQRPTMTDQLFMKHTTSPINIYPTRERWQKKFHLKFASAVARVLA